MPKTSVYLTDELAAAVKTDPRPLAEIIRAGLRTESDEKLAAIVREAVAEGMRQAS
jgi:hypothetical protein